MPGRPDKPEEPDIEFTADVRSKTLRFEKKPRTEVRFPGHPERESASGTDRVNLPDEVEPGVTYENAEVRLRIATALTEDGMAEAERKVESDETRRQG